MKTVLMLYRLCSFVKNPFADSLPGVGAISDQFRGFRVRDKQNDRGFLNEIGPDTDFWTLAGKNAARPWFLIAYNNTFDKPREKETIISDEFKKFLLNGLSEESSSL